MHALTTRLLLKLRFEYAGVVQVCCLQDSCSIEVQCIWLPELPCVQLLVSPLHMDQRQ